MSRQKIADAHRRWLLGELADWQTEGLLTPAQVEVILARYETDEELDRRKQSLAVFTLLGMAAFLFGLAVLLVIGFNWESMARGVKLGIILAVVTGTYVVGFYLRSRAPTLSEVVLFLGCMFYGAGIWLVAQVFHLDAHYPDGVWWWAIGVLPFALCLDSLLCHLLFVALMTLWAGMEVLAFRHLSPWYFFGWSDLPNGAYAVVPLALAGLAWAYRKGSPITVGLYVALLSWWVILQAYAWGAEARSVFWIGSVGAILIMLAEVHRRVDPLAVPYRFWGVLLSAGCLIPLSSTEFWHYEVRHRSASATYLGASPLASAFVEAVAILTLLGITLVLVAVAKRRREEGDRTQLGESLRKQWFPAGLSVCMAALAFWSLAIPDTTAAWILPTILSNLAMLGMALYLIRVGVREERVRPFAAGILYFLIWAFARYIDLFSGAGGMLGAALLFFLCGAGLVVVARFWSRARAGQRVSGLPAALAPIQMPVWIEGPARWLSTHARPILIISSVGQLLLLGGMIVVEAAPLVVGETIVLRVTPIDPRDLFRGDYVILNYDINQVSGQDSGGAGPNRARGRNTTMQDRTVYVILEPEPDGKHWRAAGVSLHRPSSGTYIRGRYTDDYRQPVRFGIEAYFVQEGTGLEWERLRNNRNLSAEISVAPWGQAKLRRLIAND